MNSLLSYFFFLFFLSLMMLVGWLVGDDDDSRAHQYFNEKAIYGNQIKEEL